jgi:hypothetical protein
VVTFKDGLCSATSRHRRRRLAREELREQTALTPRSIRTALRAAQEKPAPLLMLGIVIAVAAVMATVSIGQGAQAKVAQQMESRGESLDGAARVDRDARRRHGATQNPTRDDATATSGAGDLGGGGRSDQRTGAQIVYGDQNWFTQVQAAPRRTCKCELRWRRARRSGGGGMPPRPRSACWEDGGGQAVVPGGAPCWASSDPVKHVPSRRSASSPARARVLAARTSDDVIDALVDGGAPADRHPGGHGGPVR